MEHHPTLQAVIEAFGIMAVAVLMATGVGFLVMVALGKLTASPDFPWHDDRA